MTFPDLCDVCFRNSFALTQIFKQPDPLKLVHDPAKRLTLKLARDLIESNVFSHLCHFL